MPQSDAERREKLLAWSAVENPFITSGVPFSVLGTPVSAHRLQRGKALCNATGAPALIVNSFGKGRAWYFNFDLTKLGLLRNKNRHAAIMDLVRCIMLDAGVKPLAAVIGADGRIIEHCAVYAYHRKPIQYLGLLPAAEAMTASGTPVRLLLPPDRTAYDVRARKMLDGPDVVLSPGVAKFIALLPYRVRDVSILAPAKVRQGETISLEISVETDGAATGDHVVRVETEDPTGRAPYYYAVNLLTRQGKASFQAPLGLNAPVGDWKFSVRDVPSGLGRTKVVKVESAPRLSPAAADSKVTAFADH